MISLEDCSFYEYTPKVNLTFGSFDCGDSDLNDFYIEDAFLQSSELLCKNYCFVKEDVKAITYAFTISNESIKRLPGSRKKKIEKNIPREKQYSSYPAVMIGRLGVNIGFQDHHLGSQVLDFIKGWLLDPEYRTGCRFLLVDSYNKPENIRFYERNGFTLLFSTEEQEREYRKIKEERSLATRLMYYDLIEVSRGISVINA